MSSVGPLLLALAGFLVGGMVSTWRSSRLLAVLLAIGAALAIVGGVTWML